jgi:hypothetical protein
MSDKMLYTLRRVDEALILSRANMSWSRKKCLDSENFKIFIKPINPENEAFISF